MYLFRGRRNFLLISFKFGTNINFCNSLDKFDNVNPTIAYLIKIAYLTFLN